MANQLAKQCGMGSSRAPAAAARRRIQSSRGVLSGGQSRRRARAARRSAGRSHALSGPPLALKVAWGSGGREGGKAA